MIIKKTRTPTLINHQHFCRKRGNVIDRSVKLYILLRVSLWPVPSVPDVSDMWPLIISASPTVFQPPAPAPTPGIGAGAPASEESPPASPSSEQTMLFQSVGGHLPRECDQGVKGSSYVSSSKDILYLQTIIRLVKKYISRGVEIENFLFAELRIKHSRAQNDYHFTVFSINISFFTSQKWHACTELAWKMVREWS